MTLKTWSVYSGGHYVDLTDDEFVVWVAAELERPAEEIGDADDAQRLWGQEFAVGGDSRFFPRRIKAEG